MKHHINNIRKKTTNWRKIHNVYNRQKARYGNI